MPSKLDSCVEKLKKEGHDEDSAWAICNDSVKTVKKNLDIPFDSVFDYGMAPQEDIIEHDEPKGTIVALPVPYRIATQLHTPGGNAPADMHITLAYMEHLYDEELDILRSIISSAAKDYDKAMFAKVGGIGRFSHGEEDVFYASVDGTHLGDFREYLIDRLESTTLPLSYEHGFTPHVTIKYLTKDEITPELCEDAIGNEWLVETVDIWHGNFKFKYRFS